MFPLPLSLAFLPLFADSWSDISCSCSGTRSTAVLISQVLVLAEHCAPAYTLGSQPLPLWHPRVELGHSWDPLRVWSAKLHLSWNSPGLWQMPFHRLCSKKHPQQVKCRIFTPLIPTFILLRPSSWLVRFSWSRTRNLICKINNGMSGWHEQTCWLWWDYSE